MAGRSDDLVALERQRRERERIHLILLDKAERGWADVEAGRVEPIAALRARLTRRR